MTETPTKEGRGRPAIESWELPPDIRIAIQARSQGLTWKAAADRAGTTATRVRDYAAAPRRESVSGRLSARPTGSEPFDPY